MRKHRFCVLLLLVCLAMIQIAYARDSISKDKLSGPIYTAILQQYRLTNVTSLIDLKTAADVTIIRKQLMQFVFNSSTLPRSWTPQKVQHNVPDPDYADVQSLDHIDMLTLDMPYGINSNMYYFHAVNQISRLVIYHQGHKGDFIHGKETIGGLLDRGYDVIAIAMPLLGKNSKPIAHIDGFGTIYLKNHEWMRFLDAPISFFMGPILSAVQHGLESKKYRDVSLVGLSGGGWAVTLYAALDERIKNTYQVGGTMPFFLRSPVDNKYKGHLGDFEQHYVPLIKIANYLELYIMGAAGLNRKEMQIINQYDSVAAHGIKYRTYQSVVTKRVNEIGKGGIFEVVLDENNPNHSISKRILELILDDLDSAKDNDKKH